MRRAPAPPLPRLAAARPVHDRCPGALSVHRAADGGLARVRLPGGLLRTAQLAVLARAATDLGDGALVLTSRGNVQVRALPDGAERELADRLADAGLLPSATHETVRNVVASPLSGLDDVGTDVVPLVAELDAALCATPRLADLPGRVLLGLDDGRGDVVRLRPDVGLQVGPDGFVLVLAGAATDLVVAAADAVRVLLAAAEAFCDVREADAAGGAPLAWRLAEVPDGPARVLERARRLPDRPGPDPDAAPAPGRRTTRDVGPGGPPPGLVTAPDGTTSLVVGAPLGRLGPRQLDALLDAAGSSPDGLALRLTPWRDVVLARVPDAGRHLADLAASGLVTDAGSPWRGVTACTGRPGCAKALADVHADAAAALAGAAPGGPVHWSGCGRRCGHPAGDHVDVLATPTGYAVDGAATASGGLAATVGAARAHHRTAARA